MNEKNKRIARRWMSTALIITMLFACVINDISLPYISWAGESASAPDARNKRVTLVKTEDEDVQITVLSDEQSYESGDEVGLELVITNNSDGEIKDGLLKYGKSSGIEEDTAYFEDVNDAYVQNVQVIRTEKDKTDESIAEESKEEESSKASEPETTETPETTEPDVLETPTTTEGEANELEELTTTENEANEPEAQKPQTEDENDANLEEGKEAEENNRKNDEEDDGRPQYLSELNIAPGESYHVNFYYTVPEDIEKITNKGIEFTFRGIKETEIKDEYGEVQDTETKNFTVSKKFLYTANGMNLLSVAFAGDEEGKLIRGEEAKMTLDFSLGNLEAALDEWAMENDNGDVSSPSDSSSDKKASGSNAPRITSALIKWEGDKKAASTNKKEEQPIVQNLHCEVEIPGVTLNDFMVTGDASEDDDYNTSAVCSFTIDRKMKPGTYYGEVKASYDVKDGKRKASGKSTQGIKLEVSQTKDEAVLEVIGLIDELPEFEEAMAKIQAFWEEEDEEGEAEYRIALLEQVQVAYTQYSYLTDEQKEMVDNSEKLLTYVDVLGVEILTDLGLGSKEKEPKDNRLTPIKAADTNGLITVNLYDYYSREVNDKYDANQEYPGFRHPGVDNNLTSITAWNQGFGDYITTDGYINEDSSGDVRVDDGWGRKNVTWVEGKDAAKGEINKTAPDLVGPSSANRPISGAVYPLIGDDGYPCLTATENGENISLQYLFTEGAGVRKVNNKSINGLFLYNKNTGAYTFNSRTHHAEYNELDDTFDLYDEIITSNFVQYPFGNFLPFQKINTECTQVSTINKNHLEEVIKSANYKYEHGQGNNYKCVSNALGALYNHLKNKFGANWNGANAINQYFEGQGIPKRFTKDELTNIYNIDYDEATNFFFGMEMEMNFEQPEDGMTGLNGNELMEFLFTGDDDVMVYVDGILFLDLSGIHRHLGGRIDFQKGIVEYRGLDKPSGDVGDVISRKTFEEIIREAFKKAGKTDEEINNKINEMLVGSDLREKGIYRFKNFTTHNFKFYYMERGAGSGVCRMNFNFPLRRTVSIGKELSVDKAGEDKASILGDTEFRFQVWKEGGTELFIPAGTEYEVYKDDEPVLDDDGNAVIKTVDSNGIITIKGGEEARFKNISGNTYIKYFVRELLNQDIANQYGEVTVTGKVDTETVSGETVTVGSETFIGYDSPVKNIYDNDSTKFSFNNQVTFDKLSTLEISKVWDESQTAPTDKEFSFEVLLDDKKVPKDTAYEVTAGSAADDAGEEPEAENSEESKGSAQTRTEYVETAGIIRLKPGETAKISKILAGSEFKVKEVDGSGSAVSDYEVKYKVDGKEVMPGDGNYVSGMIKLNNGDPVNVKVEVVNKDKDISVPITVKKTLANPDGKEHTYSFELVETTDETGQTEKEYTKKELEVTVKPEDSNIGSGIFTLNYPARSLEDGVNTYYYRIREVPDPKLAASTSFDETVYMVKVEITKAANQLTEAVWYKKQGDTADFTTALKIPPLSFENTLLRELIIRKELSGEDNPDKEFKFDLSIQKDGNLVKDVSYNAKLVAADSTETSTTVALDGTGNAEITLKHNEALHVYLPYDATGQTWTVTEKTTAGYNVSYKIEDGTTTEALIVNGKTASQTLTNNSQTVTFINSPGHELPETGGPGTFWYTFGGLVLMAFALMYNILRRRKVLI